MDLISEIAEPPAHLIEAIEANPDNPVAYSVYGDWLLEHGDLLGEIISLTVGHEKTWHEVYETRKEKRAEYMKRWFPEFENTSAQFGWTEGFGTIYRVRAHPTSLGRELFEAICICPGTRFLRELELTLDAGSTDPSALMAHRGFPKTLRSFSFEYGIPIDLAPLVPKLAHVEELSLSQPAHLGPLDLPRLNELTVTGFSATNFDAMVSSKLPALERLTIVGCDGIARFDLPAAPSLERLTAYCRGEIAPLAASPLLKRIRELQLHAFLTDDNLDDFTAVLPAFQHLEELVIGGHKLSEAHQLRLSNALKPRLVLG